MNTEKPRSSRMDKGVVIGLVALLINLVTVSVFIYQTNLMRQQQHASVWPYVEWKAVYNQETGFKLAISNFGIGPARLVQTTMTLDGVEVSDLDALFISLIDTTYFPHSRRDISKRVIPANTSIELFKTADSHWSSKLDAAFRERDFRMQICYESIYQDAWITDGSEVREGRCP